jgi:hypothetical protein
MKKRIFLIALTVILCVAVIKLWPASEEEHVKNDIEALKEAVEKKDTTLIFSYIDRSYSDKDFANFEELETGINDFFAAFDSISILMSNIKVNIDSVDEQQTAYATCSLGLKVFAEYEGDKVILYGGIVKPAPAQVYLKKVEGHYKIYHAVY